MVQLGTNADVQLQQRGLVCTKMNVTEFLQNIQSTITVVKEDCGVLSRRAVRQISDHSNEYLVFEQRTGPVHECQLIFDNVTRDRGAWRMI